MADRVKIGAVCYKGNHLDLDGMDDRGVCGSHEYQSIYLVVETDYPNPRGDAPLTASHVAAAIRDAVEADEQARFAAEEQPDREPSDATLEESAPDLARPVDMRSDFAYPSDAEVKIALDTYFACDFYADYPRSVPYHEPRMRAALLAAQEVRHADHP